MKHFSKIKYLVAVVLILFGFSMAACEDDITLGKKQEDKYLPNDANIYIVDKSGKKDISTIEFRGTGSTIVTLKLNKALESDLKASLEYDKLALDKYNKENDTDYEAFPSSLVSFANDGTIELVAGNQSSDGVELVFKSDGKLDASKTYVIPFTAKLLDQTTQLIGNSETSYLIFIKDMTSIPDPDKYVVGADGVSRRVQIVSCMEINDTNPLNNLSFTLKNSGKPLIDIVILFSANINYNDKEERVYIHQNEQVATLLSNREKYLKPLQDRGIKVVLGILPNHDRASITNLAEETAKGFAQELKAYMNAYQLDGVFWDDEYSKPIYPAPPGFVEPSDEATSFLVYEFNRVMPDKLNMVYVYSGTGSLSTVEGKRGGEYITHALHDYGGAYDLSNFYPGLEKSGWGMYSQEFNRGRWASTSSLTNVKNNGYCHMIFAMDPNRENYTSGWGNTQKKALQEIAKYIYDDELVEGEFYKKDY